jgi:hypothetical protein
MMDVVNINKKAVALALEAYTQAIETGYEQDIAVMIMQNAQNHWLFFLEQQAKITPVFVGKEGSD